MRAPNGVCGECGRPNIGRRLTKRQREMFDFIVEFIDANGYAPTYNEIAAHFGYRSLATVSEHVCSLQRAGLIGKRFNEVRSIVVIARAEGR